ncbi:MAG: HNH endonuclease [Solirubrobacteraceae bacterium]|nr:HNH endonuclease [Solirubrobacteraceae bacterium]
MARSRKDAWLRDELVLALDLYRREGRNPPKSSVDGLSDLLRTLPVEPELAGDPGFRNANSVQLKIYNFVSIDPDSDIEGMPRIGRGDREVWDEFARDDTRLSTAATGIRESIDKMTPSDTEVDEEIITEAPEGRLLTAQHVRRERNAKLVASKKTQALNVNGKLVCEACGFDFAAVYGAHGDGFIECHHTKPVHTLRAGQRTRLEDLALVCSNCHRMIHRRKRWLMMDELRTLIATASTG